MQVRIKFTSQSQGDCYSFSRKLGSGKSTELTQRVKDLIEEEMQKDDEAKASQIGHIFT